jgi:serine/threonine protein kinase
MNHPSFPSLRHFFALPSERNYYFIFDHIQSSDLYTFLEKRLFEPLPEEMANDWFHQLIEMLAHLHEQAGIVHRDIKLDNILVDPESKRLYMIDFGLCGFLDSNQSNLFKDWVGSSEYLAPEVIRQIPYDGRKADIFSRKS